MPENGLGGEGQQLSWHRIGLLVLAIALLLAVMFAAGVWEMRHVDWHFD